MRNLTQFLYLLLVAASMPLTSMAAKEAPSVATLQSVSEDDWFLPDWVKTNPDVVDFYGAPPEAIRHPEQTLKLLSLRWKDVNPKDGVYDWNLLREALAGPGPIYLRLENAHVIHCPDWLQIKYPDLKAQILKGEKVEDNWEKATGGTYYPLWHAGLKKEFKNLLKSFKQEGFSADPRFRYLYIPGAWAWGEFGVPEDLLDQMIAQGLTPQQFLDWFQEIVDAYVDAVGEKHAYKLMFTGADAIENCLQHKDWQDVIGRNLFKYVIDKGGSTRFGLLEKFDFGATDMPNYGISAQMIGEGRYMVADESAGLLANPLRLIGAENEELGNSKIWKNYYQCKMTILKSLQIRVNNVYMMGTRVFDYAPEVHEYMIKSLGKHCHDSADAWCALREGRDQYQEWSRWNSGSRGQWWVRNFERWLIQREVSPGGETERTYRIDSPVKFNEVCYEARKTRHSAGSDYIYFGVEDRFLLGGPNRVQIKVSYLDDSSSSWRIEYDAASGDAYQQTKSVTNLNDGKWKTVTLSLDDAGFTNRQNSGMDFRIYNGGSDDLTVRFVRVIKLDPPTPTPLNGDAKSTAKPPK